jgi:hypothetical protein
MLVRCLRRWRGSQVGVAGRRARRWKVSREGWFACHLRGSPGGTVCALADETRRYSPLGSGEEAREGRRAAGEGAREELGRNGSLTSGKRDVGVVCLPIEEGWARAALCSC